MVKNQKICSNEFITFNYENIKQYLFEQISEKNMQVSPVILLSRSYLRDTLYLTRYFYDHVSPFLICTLSSSSHRDLKIKKESSFLSVKFTESWSTFT
jgi:hypothetical protein